MNDTSITLTNHPPLERKAYASFPFPFEAMSEDWIAEALVIVDEHDRTQRVSIIETELRMLSETRAIIYVCEPLDANTHPGINVLDCSSPESSCRAETLVSFMNELKTLSEKMSIRVCLILLDNT